MNSRLICHVMTKLLPWNLARWLLESRVCVYFSRAQPVVSVSLLDLEEGGQWKVSFCRSISLVAWLFTMRCSCCSQCDPSQGVPALVGLLGRAMHSQGAVWWQGDLCQARGASKRAGKLCPVSPFCQSLSFYGAPGRTPSGRTLWHRENNRVVPGCPGISAPAPPLFLEESYFYFFMTI